jgi:UDP-N-acetylglucosamine 2-epimerase (non-hydrolysing)
MKIAPLLTAFRKSRERFECLLVHTGQHYDVSMSDVFFAQLGLPEPDIHLGVGAGSQATQTGRTMEALESVLEERAPDLVIVVGDVNSTLAAAIVAAKAGVPLAHVEAGLRSFDRRMPEEVNRVVTDALATYLFVTEEDAVENLRREGVADERIFMVGNVMIDTLMALLPQIKARAMSAELGLRPGAYGVVTLHRPSNVDDAARLESWVAAFEELAVQIPLVFPAHPRTRGRLIEAGLIDHLGAAGIRVVDPLPYIEFVSLVADSKLVLTDSGGIQEETTVLGVSCVTLRDTTERPVTVAHGTNHLVGADPMVAIAAAKSILAAPSSNRDLPPLWDGRAAERIVERLRTLDWRARRSEAPHGMVP